MLNSAFTLQSLSLKRGLMLLMLCILTALISACGGGGGGSATSSPPTTSDKAALTVQVQAPDGSSISGVSILASSGISASSDAQGTAKLDLATAQDITLALTKAGVANQIKVVRIPTGSTSAQLRVTMLAREAAQTLADIGVGGIVQGKDGAQASFPADSLVDAAGNVVTGAVQMQITPVNVLANAQAFPGTFSGTQGTGTAVAIVSYGTAEFHPTQSGQKLQVAPGKTVTIEIPMYADKNPDGSKVLLGQAIPLWSLNETTGIWKQEGTGMVVASAGSPTGLALRASVSHFSWWNCDDITGPEARINVKCMLLDGSGNPTVPIATGQTCTVRAEVSDTARRPVQRADTVIGPSGGLDLRVPAGTLVELYGESNFSGMRMSGLSVINQAANTTREVVIGLVGPIETTLLQPTSNASFAGNITASVQVASAVDKVELYLGGIKISEKTTTPFEFNFSTSAFNEGFTTIQARAIRGSAVAGFSELRPIIIDRTAPIITLTRLNASAGNGLVQLRASVQDLSGVNKVEFFRGSTKIGEDSTAPYELAYTLQAADAAVVSFTARATDAAGNAGVSNAITFGTQAPTVTLALSPTTHPIIASQNLLLTANASSSNGIARVEFFKGLSKIGEVASTPYQLSHLITGADVPQAQFMAKAVDNAGIIATAQQSVAVSITSTDTVPPTVALDALASPITSGAVLLAATATDNVAVAKVEFYLNGVLKGERTVLDTGKYRLQVDVSLLDGTTVNFVAIAYDAAGNTAQSSRTASVSIAATLLANPNGDLIHRKTCAPSMGMSADGTTYVVHVVNSGTEDPMPHDAVLSRRVNGVWQAMGAVNDVSSTQIIGTSGFDRICPAIAVSSTGQLYVALRVYDRAQVFPPANPRNLVRRLDGNTWTTIRDIALTINSGDDIKIAIDNLDRPVIVWSAFSQNNQLVNVERFNGSTWQTLAANAGQSGDGVGSTVYRFAIRPDNSIAIVKTQTSGFGSFIHALDVSDSGIVQRGKIGEVGDGTQYLNLISIAATNTQTFVALHNGSYSQIKTRILSSDFNSVVWTQIGTDAELSPDSANSLLAFHRGSLVQVNPILDGRNDRTEARRWNGLTWSAFTSLSPVRGCEANLYQSTSYVLFMSYWNCSPHIGSAFAGVARINVP